MLLDRAFNGTEKVVKRRDGSEERMLEYSNQLGLTLLKMHRDTALEANSELPPENVDEMPPANPSVGSCYIVAASPTGAWVGKPIASHVLRRDHGASPLRSKA